MQTFFRSPEPNPKTVSFNRPQLFALPPGRSRSPEGVRARGEEKVGEGGELLKIFGFSGVWNPYTLIFNALLDHIPNFDHTLIQPLPLSLASPQSFLENSSNMAVQLE